MGFTTFNIEDPEEWSLSWGWPFANRHIEGVHTEDERALKGGYPSISNEAIDRPLKTGGVMPCLSNLFSYFVCYTFQGKSVGNEPEDVQGSLSLKRLTQVLCQLFGACQHLRLNIHFAAFSCTFVLSLSKDHNTIITIILLLL